MRTLSNLRDQVWPEARKTWPFFLFVAGPTLAYVLAILAGRLMHKGGADQVRYFGTWLQLFGIAVVAQGVRELRQEFKRPTTLAAMRSRIVAIVQSFRRRNITLTVGSANIALTGVAATLSVGRVGVPTVEQRLDALERELTELRKQAEDRDRKVDSQFSAVRTELSAERQQRVEGQSEIAQKLDNVAVGGLHLDVIGLWWLLIATIATSVPDGVAWVLDRLSAYF
jgi:hypothetical protein